ncbi:hypothetical protein GGR50DRAFT_336623 [Xylaria sp. CBS 124048]|nr:hypothetical protein GGR50DRAFT_336623 [Xylaria sp. CBS 124048]
MHILGVATAISFWIFQRHSGVPDVQILHTTRIFLAARIENAHQNETATFSCPFSFSLFLFLWNSTEARYEVAVAGVNEAKPSRDALSMIPPRVAAAGTKDSAQSARTQQPVEYSH